MPLPRSITDASGEGSFLFLRRSATANDKRPINFLAHGLCDSSRQGEFALLSDSAGGVSKSPSGGIPGPIAISPELIRLKGRKLWWSWNLTNLPFALALRRRTLSSTFASFRGLRGLTQLIEHELPELAWEFLHGVSCKRLCKKGFLPEKSSHRRLWKGCRLNTDVGAKRVFSQKSLRTGDCGKVAD